MTGGGESVRPAWPSGRFAALLLAAFVLVGCDLLRGVRTFGFSFPAEDARAEVLVLLTDRSGTVVNADQAPAGFVPLMDEGFATIAENPNAIVVHWIGGACDASVAIDVRENSGILDFAVVTTKREGVCDLLGIARAVLIELSSRADASRIGVHFEP